MYLPNRAIKKYIYNLSSSDKGSEWSREWVLWPLLNLG